MILLLEHSSGLQISPSLSIVLGTSLPPTNPSPGALVDSAPQVLRMAGDFKCNNGDGQCGVKDGPLRGGKGIDDVLGPIGWNSPNRGISSKPETAKLVAKRERDVDSSNTREFEC